MKNKALNIPDKLPWLQYGRILHKQKNFIALRQNKNEIRLADDDKTSFSSPEDIHFTHSIPIEQAQWLCPISASSRPQIVCVGRNYADHAKELGNDIPKVPKLFLKPYTTLCGPNDNILYPSHMSELVHYEGEIALIIGTQLKNVTVKNALHFVTGYTLANDVTARDVQKSDAAFSRGKGFPSFCPLGPWIQSLPKNNPEKIHFETWVNGKKKQQGLVKDMLNSFAELIAFIAQVFPLVPGDVILTGTPKGVGPLFIGDKVEVCSGEMTLTNHVVAGPAFINWRI